MDRVGEEERGGKVRGKREQEWEGEGKRTGVPVGRGERTWM